MDKSVAPTTISATIYQLGQVEELMQSQIP
jgi:hypothetical protein